MVNGPHAVMFLMSHRNRRIINNNRRRKVCARNERKKTLKRIDGNVIKYSALICYPKKTAKSLRLLETEWNSSKR